jgi:transposase
MLHRTRHLFIRQQTAVINSNRVQLAELGIVAPVGRKGVEELLNVVADPAASEFPILRANVLPLSGLTYAGSRSRLLRSIG